MTTTIQMQGRGGRAVSAWRRMVTGAAVALLLAATAVPTPAFAAAKKKTSTSSRNTLVTVQPGNDTTRLNAPIVNPTAFGVVGRFPANTPGTYRVGSGAAIPFELSAPLPKGGDVLVLAWSTSQKRMVEGFAHGFAAGPFAVAADKLDLLPPGEVVLQLLVRENSRVKSRVSQPITILPAAAADVVAPGVVFDNWPAAWQQGSTASLPVKLDGAMPANGSLLALAWSVDQSKMIDGFGHELTDAPYAIAAGSLNTLPPGAYVLQVLVRVNGQPVRKTERALTITPRVAPVVMPTVTIGNWPASYTHGSGDVLAFNVDGDLPSGADIVVIAWSHTQKKLVPGFAFTTSAAPWQVPAAKLDLLPAGTHNLQLLVRKDNKVVNRSARDLTVTVPADNDNGGGTGGGDNSGGGGTGDDGDNTGGGGTGGGDNGGGTVDDGGGTGGGDNGGGTVDDGGGTGGGDNSGGPVTPFTIGFGDAAPAIYRQTSGVAIDLNVTGKLPADGDVLLLCWSASQKQMVAGFASELTAGPWTIASAKLDTIPIGDAELQAIVRTNGEVASIVRHPLTVTGPNGELPDPGDDDGGADDGDGDGEAPPPYAGDDGDWSDLKPTARVIYVSASGDDNKDGLSAANAVRTLDRGYDLVRDGEGDWLLLRRGDVFDAGSGFRNWKKSGKSAAAPLVVGAYGDATDPRPRIDSNGNTPLQMLHGQPVRHVRFMDLHLYANKRDPDSKDYDGGNGEEYGIQTRTPLEDVWFEGMLVEFFSNNVNIARKRDDGMVIRDLHFRRNVIRYSYNKQGHSQGLVMGSVQGPTYLIQNVFDHNGWNEKAGARRTQFNQNVYLNMLTNLRIEGNVFARAAYSGLKLRSDIKDRFRDGIIKNNLFIDNGVALQMSSDPTGSRTDVTVRNIEVVGNVFTRNGGQVDGKSVGLAMHLRQSGDLNIHDNLIVHKTVDTNWQAIGCGSSGPHGEILIARNVLHNWPNARGEWLINDSSDRIKPTHNLVNEPASRYVDPSVTLDKYQQSLGMSDGQFYAALGAQARGRWNDKLTADTIVRYFKNGFDLRPFD